MPDAAARSPVSVPVPGGPAEAEAEAERVGLARRLPPGLVELVLVEGDRWGSGMGVEEEVEDLAEYVLHLDKWVIQEHVAQEQVKANKVKV